MVACCRLEYNGGGGVVLIDGGGEWRAGLLVRVLTHSYHTSNASAQNLHTGSTNTCMHRRVCAACNGGGGGGGGGGGRILFFKSNTYMYVISFLYIYFYAFFCWTWCVAARTAAPERARVGWGNGATGEHGSMDGLRVQGGISLIHHVQGVS